MQRSKRKTRENDTSKTETKDVKRPKLTKTTSPVVELKREIDAKKATIMVCGSGEMLQLGIDTDTMECRRPQDVSSLQNVHIAAFAAGGGSNAVVTVSDSNESNVWTWGSNDLFALGRLTKNQDEQMLPKIIPTLKGVDIIEMSIGDNHMAALDSDGRVYTWGTYRDLNGSLQFKPNKKEEKQLEPEIMSELKKDKIIQIASGENSTLALNSTGKIYIWGVYRYNHKSSTRNSVKSSYLLPAKVYSKEFFIKVYSGSFHHFGVSKKNELFAWGLNNYGQLGFESEENIALPHKVELLNGIKIKEVDGGFHHSMLLTEDGNVYSWGRGDYGQLGHGNAENVTQPKLIETFESLPEDNRVIHISCGDNHSTAVTKLGDVYTWGFGEMCQLGHGPDEDKQIPWKINNTHEKSLVTGRKVLNAKGGGQHTLFVTIKK